MRLFDGDEEPYVIIEKHESSVGSFLFGLAVGAGVAMLLAPRSGAATRREIRRQAQRARRAAEDVADDVRGRVTESFEQARADVEQRIDTARRQIELRRTQVTRAMDAGRLAAHQAREDLERRIAETKAAYNAGAEVARAGAGADTEHAAGASGSATTAGALGETDES